MRSPILRAFSEEVDAGSSKENATKQETRAASRSLAIGSLSSLAAAVALALGLAGAPAAAADLTIGARTELTMDPHIQWLDTNTAYYNHIYSALTRIDERSQIGPDLAESWRAATPTEIHFSLRRNAVFHDGTPVTARDVVASFQRMRTIPNATSPYTGAITSLQDIRAEGDHTVVVTTTRPDPALVYGLAYIAIIPAARAQATSEDFNTGRGVIGSGPYRFVSYAAGDRLVLERNPSYFGSAPRWDRVTFRFIPDDAARVAALLGGDVDLIDFVPPRLVERIRAAPNAELHTGPSDRPIYMIMDTERDDSPFVRDTAGRRMTRNPLKDRRVRQALSLAMDRSLMARRVMEGTATPANQPTAPHFAYFNRALPAAEFNLAQARRLLTEAGYPNGFSLTIHCTNDRYVNDDRVCQAVGQMLARVGIQVEVVALPRTVFFPNATNHGPEARYSFFMLGYASSGDAAQMPNTLHSFDRARRLGTWNLGHYSNPQVDEAIQRGLEAATLEERYAAYSEAMRIAMEDVALIPLYVQSVVVATRRGLSFTTWANERTIADSAAPR